MTFSEIIQDVRLLSRSDKLQLVEYLTVELAGGTSAAIEAGKTYPIWSPESAFAAAATMMQALRDEKGRS
jgi:hypothetical protein